jgi:hypothetical protein
MTIVSRGTALLLLGSILACALLMPCKSPDSRSASGKTGKKPLSRQELIDAASVADRKYGRDPGWGFVLEENSQQLQAVMLRRFPSLRGHDCEVLRYIPVTEHAKGMADGGGWLLIDRNTGEVLVRMDGLQHVLFPAFGYNADGELAGSKRLLPDQQMIDIASAAGRRYGLDTEYWKPFFDGSNTMWRSFARVQLLPPTIDRSGHAQPPEVSDEELQAAVVARWPVLKGHGYQSFWYTYPSPRPPVPRIHLILIDRSTGEVLMAVSRSGEALTPDLGSKPDDRS